MDLFSFEKLAIPGAYLVSPFFSGDDRGSFMKPFEIKIFADNGIEFHCDEDCTSRSAKNVIRGMHFQLRHPQVKLVGVPRGKIYDVIVDLRKDSPRFGHWEGFYLSEHNRKHLLVPRGCAHGFLAMEDNTIVSYKCDGQYDKETDTGISYNDPDIAIQWPIDDLKQAILSPRDQALMSFAEFKKLDTVWRDTDIK